jgi:hypothetical protein
MHWGIFVGSAELHSQDAREFPSRRGYSVRSRHHFFETNGLPVT